VGGTDVAPLRARAAATGLDYLVISGWLAVLAAVGVPLSLLAPPHPERWPLLLGDLAVFALTVLPAGLYLGLTEAGARSATLGKRRLGLAVATTAGARPGPGRIALRTVVKLLPWQLAHLAVLRLALDAGPAAFAWTADGLALGLVALTVALAVAGPGHRALHDLAAGTVVVRRRIAP
jgi:uncharacterized RDD family membrane protein YckC